MLRVCFVSLVALSTAVSAFGAKWNVTTGGDLSDLSNWNITAGTTTWQIDNVAQSAPFTLAASTNMNGNFRYDTYAYTNSFVGKELAVSAFHVEFGAVLRHLGGTITASGDSYITGAGTTSGNEIGRLTLDGPDAVLNVVNGKSLILRAYNGSGTIAAHPQLMVTNGASVAIANAFLLYGGNADSDVVVAGSGSSLTAAGLTIGGSVNEGPSYYYGQRRLLVTDDATASFGDITVGANSSNNRMTVEQGARLTSAGTVYLTPAPNGEQLYPASSNNILTVGKGGVANLKSLFVGRSLHAHDNEVRVVDGGVLTAMGGTRVAIGYLGSNNRLFVSGEGSVVTAQATYVTVGAVDVGSVTLGTNELVVADGGRYVGLGELRLLENGAENRLVVTNNGIFETVGQTSVEIGNGARAWFDHAKAIITHQMVTKGSGKVAFVDSDVQMGTSSWAESFFFADGGEYAFTNSTVRLLARFNQPHGNSLIRVHNSQLRHETSNLLFMIGSGNAGDAGVHTMVFSGTNAWLKSVSGSRGIYFRGKVTMRFEVPAKGFSTEHAVVDAAETKFEADNWSNHTFVVDVDPQCAANGGGTYTLLCGTNADNLWNNSSFTLSERSKSQAELKCVTVGGKPAVQVRVKPAGLVILFR